MRLIEKIKQLNKFTTALIGLIIGLVVGAVIILGIRFVSYKPPVKIHYHANFAVYIDGKQEQFSNPLLYEEISMCELSGSKRPKDRAHMHELVKDVVHVEDEAVTWGNFFQSIGWNVSATYLSNDDKLYQNNDTKKVSYIINGKSDSDITNKVIADKDRLLISYGDSTKDELDKQFNSVATTAEKYDNTKDPATCSGSKTDDGIKTRLKHLF